MPIAAYHRLLPQSVVPENWGTSVSGREIVGPLVGAFRTIQPYSSLTAILPV
jgi:hypothetical protein